MVARSTWDGDVTVYKYGVPSWADLDEHGMEQLRLAHRLRNHLVEVEMRYGELKDAVWGMFPLVLAADQEVDAAQREVDRLTERAAAERSQDRTTAPRRETKQELTAARRALREAKARRRDVKASEYSQAAADMFHELGTARFAVRKALYRQYREDGLYWATINDVVASHETAVKKIADDRKQGKPAGLRFHRWDGTGTLCVQLQREAGAPQRSWEMLASGLGPWTNVLSFWPESRRRPRPGGAAPKLHWEMRFSTGRDQPGVQLPVVLDRTPPPEADITLMRVTRRKIGSRTRLSVTLTARIPAPEQQRGAATAVHFGWRVMDGGDVRVAVIAADRELQPPTHPEVPVKPLPGGAWEVRLPEKLRHAHERTDKLRSTRDRSLDLMRDKLAGWLDEYPQPHPDGQDEPGGDGDLLTGGRVRRWKSPARFAALALAWRETAPPAPGGLDMAARLESWRRQDKHLWEWEANERDQQAARVRDTWRKTAAWLADQAGMIVVDDTEIREVSRVPVVGDEDDPQLRAARRQRQVAAPGDLRHVIQHAGKRRGVTVEKLPTAHLGAVHVVCGSPLVGDRAAQVGLWCASCDGGVDQDANVAVGLLRLGASG